MAGSKGTEPHFLVYHSATQAIGVAFGFLGASSFELHSTFDLRVSDFRHVPTRRFRCLRIPWLALAAVAIAGDLVVQLSPVGGAGAGAAVGGDCTAIGGGAAGGLIARQCAKG